MELGKSNMYEVKIPNGMKYFAHEQDAINYLDYLKNGLKCINKNGNKYYFNNGSTMIFNNKICVVHEGNKTLKSEKLINKYLILIEK